MDNWAIWVDVEGFSKIYPGRPGRAFKVIGALMEGIYKLGTMTCASSPNPLFAYQVGDGFILSSGCGLASSHLPIAIAIFLHKVVALAGGCIKSAVSTGNMADIQDCYPSLIRSNVGASGCVPMGDGIMTTFPVMGTALINTHALSMRESGALLIWDCSLSLADSDGVVVSREGADYLVIDWLHSRSAKADEFLSAAGITSSANDLEVVLRDYVSSALAPNEWRSNTLKYNGILRVSKEGANR